MVEKMSKIKTLKILTAVFIFICLLIAFGFTAACRETISIEEAVPDDEALEEKAEEESPGEAPTIELELYEGPVYSQDYNVCYYRIKATVTGTPTPDLEFSRDDSNGILGEYMVQVNLSGSSDTYTLSASVSSPEGTAVSNIILNWGCGELEAIEEKTYTYGKKELEYFFETALGSEFGASQPEIHKWTDDVRIKVNGTPTSADLDSLDQVITELNSLIGGISIDIISRDSNIDIYFTAVDKFSSIEPDYVTGNMGFFWGWWDDTGAIYKGKILIASNGVSQQERSHLIREELTQSLGIMNDSYQYEDSIFYQGCTDIIEYAPIDQAVISLLYDSRVKPGMSQDQIITVLDISWSS